MWTSTRSHSLVEPHRADFCMDVAATTAQKQCISDLCWSGFLVCGDEFLQNAQCNS